MGQDGHIFFLLHDSYQRPNYPNPGHIGHLPPELKKYNTYADFDMAARQST